MSTLAQLLGFDDEDPAVKRQIHLSEADLALRTALTDMRRRKGLSQADVAERMNVTQSTISTFESMKNDPKLSTMRRYAGAIGVLIHHHVEDDTGQLFDDRRDDWTRAYSRSTE